MDSGATLAIRNGSIPFTDLVRAGVSSRPVSMPLAGSAYTRLEYVAGVPASPGDQGYSLVRLKALDALIARIRGAQEAAEARFALEDPLQAQEELLEEVSLRIVDDLKWNRLDSRLLDGFLVDMTA